MTGEEGLFNALLVANCVLNAFLSFIAIVFNIIAIQALRKTSLAKPLKTLLLSLAMSDLGVDLLVQPLYIAVGVGEIRRNSNYNNVINVFIIRIKKSGSNSKTIGIVFCCKIGHIWSFLK